MSDMNESIFSRLFRYRETSKQTPGENYLTEMLAWMVDSLPQFGCEYVHFLCGKCKTKPIAENNDLFDVSAQTQVKVEKGFIDMVITTDCNIGFICEHKVDSSLSDNQIQKYYDCREQIDASLDFKTVLLTKRMNQHTQESDIKLIWRDLYEHFSGQLESAEYDANEKIFIEQFLMYLTEVGMGKKNNIQLGSVENYCEAMKFYSEAINVEKTLKSIFSEIFTDTNWEEQCKGIKEFVKIYDPSVHTKRWGRLGIDFQADWEKWEPSIFAGVILDNYDHDLNDFKDQPQLVILIDWNVKKKPGIRNTSSFKEIIATIPDSENGFYIDKSPKNEWRLLILQKPLKDALKHDKYEEQKNDIVTEIISGINIILKYFNGTKLGEIQ